MPLYPKRIQIGVEIWFADYFDKMVESLGIGEGELGRVLLALGAGVLESHLADHGCERFFTEIGMSALKGDLNALTRMTSEEKARLFSKIFFKAQTVSEERMRMIAK